MRRSVSNAERRSRFRPRVDHELRTNWNDPRSRPPERLRLNALRDPLWSKEDLITWEFPTDAHRDEYLRTIGARSDQSVRALLRRFLLPSCSLGGDTWTLSFLWERGKKKEPFPKTEFVLRLFRWGLTKGRVLPWEGVTWVLDLLPDSPREALEVIDAYFRAHVTFIPEGRMHGLFDASAIIRAKYITVGDVQSCDGALESLSWRDLEVLVAALYRARGYDIRITRPSADGGRDVIATKRKPGEKERCLIECKHHSVPVGVKEIRALGGVVADEKATKGVLVSTSSFTAGSEKFAKRNDSLELIGRAALIELLNEHLGTSWPLRLDLVLGDEKQCEQAKSSIKNPGR